MIYYIYVLIDPITNKIRYVGQTTNIKRRLWEHTHILEANPSKDIWVESLLKKSMIPVLDVIEHCTEDNHLSREQYWINRLYYCGCNLFNREAENVSRRVHRKTLTKVVNKPGIIDTTAWANSL